MQVILIVIPAISLIFAAFGGQMGEMTSAVLAKSGEAVELVISLCGVICLWSGVMRVAQRAGILEKLARILSPIVSFLFKGVKKGGKAAGLITMNIAANILGLGNASTPLGIAAMKAIAEEDASFKGDIAADDMIMLAVLNTASLQIVPTTAAALRAANGAEKPFNILPCVWIVSVYSVVLVVAATKVMCFIQSKRSNRKI
ncbi:MAG: hypothetical protein MR364_07480 [Oscillospiraceae bacterium]|nr:hypothetical protein [Oscillospiraceae bacterium]